MNSYNFEPGEFLVLQETDIKLGTSSTGEDLSEIVLSNSHLILVNEVSRGLFKSDRFVKRCPLSQLKRTHDEPQLPVIKQGNSYCLQVLFESETIPLLFTSSNRRSQATCRRAAERWADAIRQAADGNLNSIQGGDLLPSELADVIDGTKDFLGSISGRKQQPKTTAKSAAMTMASARCPGCHAPLTGQSGSIATCPYCGTKHAL